ncbi:ParA family protein [Luteimonas sp. S4-F44]|jgi:chromosome partitioning protein|uniref:ParA family protein n=1 Tax=unclassified Luteimonas TaxID=2629088 RepID=UPI000B8DA80A|nr:MULTISPECIES: ParA family protein [unclassified Luteimonas]ASR44381.1 chromosome partitioning protein ParA [Xanthomonas citri pv. mangiferaeindicae]MBB3344434.1 chromosome partitioning protein [Luteimonas sp. RC10]UNK43942.1 ParA family protein [Luteimonas sp. S4-F44]
MRVWAIANQKGGVGKTTTTLALGRAMVARGLRVLLVDLDPHASLTRAFGIPTDPPPAGVADLFATPPSSLAALMRASPTEGLDYVCAQTALATLERRSATQPGLGLALSQAITRHTGGHDAILLDCPPTLGLLMVNALAAADRVIVPTQCEPLALYGLAGMVRTAEMVERSRQRPLPVSVVPTMYDRRTRIGRETLAQLQDEYAGKIWDEAVPVDTQLSNADALAQQVVNGHPPGRAFSAYGRALDWLLAEDQALEHAA